ncbi:hypothetical protein NEFER03_1293 [Nematocida sp. LUAm3]|nr:hypothetical protein NEFER03_1293 [Nematocida sp. LUAm3]KAI5174085.1 hypothetical protein NEFER02_0552 [Nematocida sp. LUAm2]KAI5177172.1 hypothetical protein NEFER01_0447 [Nematocida sp. LUAm1]
MEDKEKKPKAFSPLVSDYVWSDQYPVNDWKVIGNSSLGRHRSNSIVGRMVSGSEEKLSELSREWMESSGEGRARSMSTSAIPGLAIRLGLEKSLGNYPEILTSLQENFRKDPHPDKDAFFTSRRHSMDPILFYEPSRCEKERIEKKKMEYSASGPRERLYIVQFGGGSKALGTYKGVILEKGTFVIIEADRGEDCGSILMEFSGKNIHEVIQKYSLQGSEIKKIYRIATEQDKFILLEQNELEIDAIRTCQEKIESKNLSMEIIGAEYQWDRNKLTFYFRSEKRIDFRDLVKELYKMYKTRIWMCAVEKKAEKTIVMKHEPCIYTEKSISENSKSPEHKHNEEEEYTQEGKENN